METKTSSPSLARTTIPSPAAKSETNLAVSPSYAVDTDDLLALDRREWAIPMEVSELKSAVLLHVVVGWRGLDEEHNGAVARSVHLHVRSVCEAQEVKDGFPLGTVNVPPNSHADEAITDQCRRVHKVRHARQIARSRSSASAERQFWRWRSSR